MHMLPQLRKLEEKYSGRLVVIGVHSAKFMAERAEAGLRNAVRRHELRHPVVNDADFRVWREYTVRAWPTLIFIDPQGKVVGKHEGEAAFEQLDPLLSEMLQEYESEGLLDPSPVAFESEPAPEGPLLYPGKLLTSGGSRFIADSGHNRVIETTLTGELRRVWGDGTAGLRDGTAEEAQLNHPQGLALRESELYVADTENHAVRKLDLNSGSVRTVAGTGEQARSYAPGGALGSRAALSSPWDLAIVNDVLYIAMAGTHQIWMLDLASGLLRPFAGTGNEGIKDGPASQAWLAQPSGITTDGSLLYFADSETSSLRTADPASGRVETIVGMGLFEFGDVDGAGGLVRLQHPLGVCWYEGELYVADTYNHKIKRIQPQARRSTTWLGSGEPGLADGTGVSVRFHEPSGLSALGGKLYIADTNNHAVRVAEIATGEVRTLSLVGL